MADLFTENQRLRDELTESSALMRRQCEVMKRVTLMHDSECLVMRQRHDQMVRLVSMLQRAMQKKDISPDNLPLFLHKMAAPGDPPEDAGNLKAQVFSLFQELKELQNRYDVDITHARQQAEAYRALELQCCQYEKNISKQRMEDDEVINALQAKMTDLETALTTQRRLTDMAILEKTQVHAEFKKLFNDHHDLLKQTETSTRQNLQPELEHLRAEHQVALQSLTRKELQMKELDEQVVLLTEQANVYRSDFNAERKAREEMHTEKDNLKEELKQVKAENTRLQAMATQQETAKTYRCPMCQQMFEDMNTLQTHMLTCIV